MRLFSQKSFPKRSIIGNSPSLIRKNALTQETLSAPQHAHIQTKLKISSPGDQYEQEADQLADQVMRMPAPQLQRACACGGGCAGCRADDTSIQLKTKTAHSNQQNAAPAIVNQALNSPGQTLDSSTKAFFEPRFGYEFSKVRIHTDTLAAKSARSINALAYTAKNQIVFANNAYQPQTSSGNRLLAHELTHVIQQSGATDAIQRTVAPSSTCAANVHHASANPLADLARVDALAQNMALGASGVLFLEALTFNDPNFGQSYVYDAYRNWFGTPQQTTSGAWRSRFRTATFASEAEAARHEMQTLSERFSRIAGWLAQDIHYRCPGTSAYTLPGCATGHCGNKAAQTCHLGSHTVGICPNFWLEPAPQDMSQAALLIHETIHPLFHYQFHSTASAAGRGRNPGCYQGFVLSIYNTGLIPADCTSL